MINVPASGPITPGYDVSHWNPNLKVHAQMAAASKKFCLIKCDEGVVHDKMFAAHWSSAKAAGMIVGAYNFFHPTKDPLASANDLVSLVGKLGPGELGAICDNETDDGAPNLDADAAFTFLMHAQSLLGKTSIYYGGSYFSKDHLKGDTRFLAFPLWVPHYGPSMATGPLVPPPWKTWTFWQYTSSGGQDLNVFNGDLATLQKMAGL